MKINQEVIKVGIPQVSNPFRIKVSKYHISKKGTARLNKWWKYFNQGDVREKTVLLKKEIEVKRVVE